MAVAMLLYVRATLLEGDYTSTLRRLLKYPPVEHVHTLVERALQLRRAFGADANGEPAVAGGFPRGGSSSRGGGFGFAPPQDAAARAPSSARGTAADQQRWQQRGTAAAGGGGNHAAAGHAAPSLFEALASASEPRLHEFNSQELANTD